MTGSKRGRRGSELAPGLLRWTRLGSGELTVTWLAWSVGHWAPVTVKTARARQARRARDYLAGEARLLTRLRHPALQRLLEDHTDKDRPYLVLEYAEGPTLDTLVAANALSPRDIRLIALQVLSVLHYVHCQGLAHLDITPANVVLVDGRVVLLDVELAKPFGYRRSGPASGTQGFQAPEYLAGDAVTAAMDVYSVGALLATLNTQDERLRHDISRLLAADPHNRPSTAAQALIDLSDGLGPRDRLWPDWAGAALTRCREPRATPRAGTATPHP